MENFKVLSIKPLAAERNYVYKGVAYDGCFFYFSQPQEKKVFRCDMECNREKCFQTIRGYYSMCYDLKEHCFWASGNDCSNRLYQLDEKWNEIDILEIDCGRCGEITGVSYVPHRDKLLVSFLQCVAEVDKKTGVADTRLHLANRCYKSVLSVAPYEITSQIDGNDQTISVYSKNHKLLEQFQCPKGYVVEDMLLRPYQCDDEYCIYLLATKQGKYSGLIKCGFSTDIYGRKIDQCNFDVNPGYNDWPDQYDKKYFDAMALIDVLLAYLMNRGTSDHTSEE